MELKTVGSIYFGVCRNSFHEMGTALFLTSPFYELLQKISPFARQIQQKQIIPTHLFLFGACAGGIKEIALRALEIGDQNALCFQRNHRFLFKIFALTIAFFSAYEISQRVASQLGVALPDRYTLAWIEGIDLFHQILFYSPPEFQEINPL